MRRTYKKDRESREKEVVEFATWDIKAMYPSLRHDFVIREIDEAIIRVIKKKEGKGKERVKRLREIVMPLLIFALQHQFLYVLSEGIGEEEEKIFYYRRNFPMTHTTHEPTNIYMR